MRIVARVSIYIYISCRNAEGGSDGCACFVRRIEMSIIFAGLRCCERHGILEVLCDNIDDEFRLKWNWTFLSRRLTTISGLICHLSFTNTILLVIFRGS